MFLIVIGIEIGDLIHKVKQIFKAQLRLFFGDLPAAVCCLIAKLADKIHPAPDVVPDNTLEILAVHQSNEVILIRHSQLTVNRIHPFDRKLYCPAAVHHAGIYVDIQQLFGGYCNI